MSSSYAKQRIRRFFKNVFSLILIAAITLVGYYIFFYRDTPRTVGETTTSATAQVITAPVFDIAPDGTGYYRYYYETLTESQKLAYCEVLEKIYTIPTSIKVPKKSVSDGFNDVLDALLFDNPELFLIAEQPGSTSVGERAFYKPSYRMSSAEYGKRMEEINRVAEKIVNLANQYSTDYEKELFVHDYLINHCEYKKDLENGADSSMYGCLVLGKASCAGYARAFRYILCKLNIDNCIVTGSTDESAFGDDVDHAWNYVRIGGEGYHVDVTWDDPVGNEAELRHSYFNVTSEDISIDHMMISPKKLDACTADTYNYFVRTSSYFDNVSGEDFLLRVEKAAAIAYNSGYSRAELKFASRELMDEANRILIRDRQLLTVYDNLKINDDSKTVSVQKDYEQNVMYFLF